MNRTKKNPAVNNQSNNENDNSELNEALLELFVDELSDVYSAEKQLVDALPDMVEAAKSEELREALESHLEETQGHVKRLEEVAKSLDEKLKKKTCKAMKGLVEEASEIIEEQGDTPVCDAALIAAGQKVEHYEIATYGTLCAWAKQLDQTEALELLQETLEEEKAADEKLTSIAETSANSETKE